MNESLTKTNRVIEIVLNGYEKAIQELKDIPPAANQEIHIYIYALHEDGVKFEEWCKTIGGLIAAINARKDIVSIETNDDVSYHHAKGIFYFLSRIQLPSSLKEIYITEITLCPEEGLINDLDALDALFKNNPFIEKITIKTCSVENKDVIRLLNSIRRHLDKVTCLDLDNNNFTEKAIKDIVEELEYARKIQQHPLKYLEVLRFHNSDYEYCPASFELILELVSKNPQIRKLEFYQDYLIHNGERDDEETSVGQEIKEQCNVIRREINALLKKRSAISSLLQLSSKEILKMNQSEFVKTVEKAEKNELLKTFSTVLEQAGVISPGFNKSMEIITQYLPAILGNNNNSSSTEKNIEEILLAQHLRQFIEFPSEEDQGPNPREAKRPKLD